MIDDYPNDYGHDPDEPECGNCGEQECPICGSACHYCGGQGWGVVGCDWDQKIRSTARTTVRLRTARAAEARARRRTVISGEEIGMLKVRKTVSVMREVEVLKLYISEALNPGGACTNLKCTACGKKLGAKKFGTAWIRDGGGERSIRLCWDCAKVAQAHAPREGTRTQEAAE